MRKLLLAAFLGLAAPAWAQYPTPTFQTHTTLGAATMNGGGTLGGTWGGNPTFSGAPVFSGNIALQGTTTIGTNTLGTSLILNGQSGASRDVQWNTAGAARWKAQMVNAESGDPTTGSGGGDLRLFSFLNGGGGIGEVWRWTRGTGNVTMNPNNTFTTPTLSIHGIIQIPGGTYGNQFLLMNSGTWTIPAGAMSLSNSPFLMNTSLASSGIVTPSTVPGLINLNIGSDQIQFDDTAQLNQIGDIEIHHTMGGGNYQGQREGLGLQLNFAAPALSTSTTIPTFLGLHITSQMTATSAGALSSGQPNTAILEGADFVVLNSSANTASAVNMAGVEVDIQNQGSIAPLFHYAFLGYSGAGDGANSGNASGSLGDAAFHTASGVSGTVGNGMGWLCQFCVGKRGTPYPGQPNSTVFGVVPYTGQDGLTTFGTVSATKLNSPQVTNIFDFSRVLANGSGNGTGRALAVPQFLVDDQGVTYVGSAAVTPSSTGVTLDTPLYHLASVSSVGATTGKVFLNDYVWEETCKVRGFLKITGVSGTNASAVDLTQGAPSGCVTNPATLTFKNDSGGSFVANVTWTAPTAQTIQIGATSASVLVGTGSALATNATTGFLQVASMAGAPTGNCGGAAGKACLVVDTTNKKVCYNVSGTTWECSAAFTP